jgi:phosphoglycolate phosphatase
MKKLLLFDIDKTLITNSSEKSFSEPIKNLHDIVVKADEDFSGFTDKLILAKLLSSEGWNEEQIQTSMPMLVRELDRTYAVTFKKNSVRLLPGVKELLEALLEYNVLVGLVTGNLKQIAKLKLEAADIYQYFMVGGFGDDSHTTRADLVNIAIERANFQNKRENVYVIGDTELDIEASFEAGVENAVAVSNGFRTRKQLLNSGAKIVLDDFTDTDFVLQKFGLN